MRFRGITLAGAPCEFRLTDCPVRLNDNMIALTNRPKSPLIHAKSVARMNDDGTLAEFDIVYNAENYKAIGMILYCNEFGVYDHRSDTFTRLRDIEYSYGVLRNKNINYVSLVTGKLQNIKWKAGNVVFSIQDVFRIVGNNLFVTTKMTEALDIGTIRLCTGLKKNKKDICFGDILSDGIVVLKYNRPMVKLIDGEFRDLREDEYDVTGAEFVGGAG